MKPTLALVSLLLSAALHSGCAGYRVGSQLPADIQSVYMHIPVNTTEEALLENAVSRAFLARLRRDGSLRIAPEDQADSIVFIEITGYDTEALAYSGVNRNRPNEYRLLISANISLVRRDTGGVITQSGTLVGRGTFNLSGDMTSSRRTALRPAAEDLARRMVATITEAWIE